MSCDIIHDAADGVTLHSLYFCGHFCGPYTACSSSPVIPWKVIPRVSDNNHHFYSAVELTSSVNVKAKICGLFTGCIGPV